jgi:hypothetical protein
MIACTNIYCSFFLSIISTISKLVIAFATSVGAYLSNDDGIFDTNLFKNNFEIACKGDKAKD